MASIARTPPVPAPGTAAGLRERARGALLGLAVGDALGAPAENLRPSEIRARWGRITGYVTEQPCGTDDTEYAIFSGLLLARHGSALTPAHVEAAWHEWIADRAEGPFRGAGFSERGTLENLRRGLAAPISAQHRHAWSDGLAMRAAPFGVFAAGRPAEAARLVAVDGSVSHEGEGIYGGQAVAAGVAAAMSGASVPVVIATALAVVPDDSWTARSLRRAVAVAHRGERAVRSAVVIGGYPWTDLAPEAVALAFGAYAAADGDFREAVLTAVNMGRDADTTAAVAGALSGATQGVSAIPVAWATAIGPARGRCLPSMAGHHVLEVADLLLPTAPADPPPPSLPATTQPPEPLTSLPATSQPAEPLTPLPTSSQPPDSASRPPEPAPSQAATTPSTGIPPTSPHPTGPLPFATRPLAATASLLPTGTSSLPTDTSAGAGTAGPLPSATSTLPADASPAPVDTSPLATVTGHPPVDTASLAAAAGSPPTAAIPLAADTSPLPVDTGPPPTGISPQAAATTPLPTAADPLPTDTTPLPAAARPVESPPALPPCVESPPALPPATSQPTEVVAPSPVALQSAEPVPPSSATSQPPQIVAPSPVALQTAGPLPPSPSSPLPVEVGEGRGSGERSPLVGAGNAGQADGEGRS
jgi:ADP-ribosylglycohydrolase